MFKINWSRNWHMLSLRINDGGLWLMEGRQWVAVPMDYFEQGTIGL